MSKTVQYLFVIIVFTVSIFSNACAEHIKYETTSDLGIIYELIIESEKPEVLKPLPVKINITDKNGNRVAVSQIACSLTMPAMAMPTNKPPIKETNVDGQYTSIFLITMGGLWNLELTTVYGSGEKEDITIPIPGVISGNESVVDSKLEELFNEENKHTN
jgi:hypothetical protein